MQDDFNYGFQGYIHYWSSKCENKFDNNELKKGAEASFWKNKGQGGKVCCDGQGYIMGALAWGLHLIMRANLAWFGL